MKGLNSRQYSRNLSYRVTDMWKRIYLPILVTVLLSGHCLVCAKTNNQFLLPQSEFSADSSKSTSPITKDTLNITMRSLPGNSLYFGFLSINLSRMIPADRFAIVFAVGVSFVPNSLFGDDFGIGFVAETTLLTSGTKHFFEPGLMAYYTPQNNGFFLPMIRIGYRFQGPKGFLFRTGIMLNNGEDLNHILPAISIGLSF